MDNLCKQRKFGVILSYISIIVNTIVQFLYTPLLIRMLGQSEYGLYSLAYSIIGYLTVFDLGFGNAIVVFTSKFKEEKKYKEIDKMLGMFKFIFYFLGLIVLLAGFIIYCNSDFFFSKTMTLLEINRAKIMILILSFNLFISFSFNIYSSIIISNENFIFQKVISILNIILKPLLMIPLLFLGYKAVAMCIGITVVNIIIILINYSYCRYKLNIVVKYHGFDFKLFKKIFIYSFFIFLMVIVDKINWSADQFILGVVSGTTAVSIYAVASHLNSLFIYLSTAISGVMLPKISKMVASNASNECISNEFIKVGRLQYYVIFLMASGLCLFGKEFFIVWAGKSYVKSYYISMILILPLCIDLIQSLGNSILQAKNLHKFKSILFSIIALINILISIPLSKMHGGIGAAVGTAISLIIGNGIITNIYYHKKVGLNIIQFWKEIIHMSIYFFIPLIIILLIQHFIPLYGLYKIIIYGILYSLIYFFVSYMLVMNSYEKNIFKTFFKKTK